MSTTDFSTLADKYRCELLENVIPFWQRHSIDRENGGYFTCLDREGNIFDTDKFIWLQCRQVWMFSKLYNELEKRQSWLDIAKIGVDFLAANGTDEAGNWYFSLDRAGRPLVEPYNIFSDCFAAMAYSQYALASGDDSARDLSLRTFKNILARKDNPKGRFNKVHPGTRLLKSLALPMIMANLALELEWMLPAETLEQSLDMCVDEVMGLFLDKERMLMFENISPDGSHPDCFAGRLLNPGHGIEAMWFIMDIAARRGDEELINQCVDVVLSTLDYAWDPEYDGIFYFMDSFGRSPEQLEWDQKLWWVHLETLVALIKGYNLTGRAECLEWFGKVHDYAWSRFADPQCGEWYGYLNRRGEVSLALKGGKWKGCFHVPRAMYLCADQLSQLAARQ